MVTLRFVPYTEIEHMSSIGRIRKLLNWTKQKKIVLLQGRLNKEEEAELIKVTMEEINKEFKGIELAVINPLNTQLTGMHKIKNDMLTLLLGNRQGMTIIGPASVVKSIKKNPNKIEIYTQEARRKKR